MPALAAPPVIQIPEAFAFLFEPSRYKAVYGGRGSAKSHSVADALLVRGIQRRRRILCCREVQRSIRDSVKRLLDDKIQARGLGKFYDSTDTEIRGANKTLFIFSGLWGPSIDQIKSYEGITDVWVEEAHSVSQKSLDVLVPTIREPDSEIICTWNPDQETDPVDVMFRGPKGPPPNSLVRGVSWHDNPFFPEVLKAEMEWDRVRDPEKYAHVWDGEYIAHSEARVFRNWRVGEPEEFATSSDTVFRFGADWGFSNDPTMLVRFFIEGRVLKIDHEARAVGCEIDKTPALFDRVPESRRWPIHADSARPETISYMQRNGFPKMIRARKGKGSIEDGIEHLKSYDIVIHPGCRHLIDEFRHYRYKTDKLTGEVLPLLEGKSDHGIDCLRYACSPIRRPVRSWLTGKPVGV